jgi:hypothetical protein
MDDLVQLQVAAQDRLVLATREAAVLEILGGFGAQLSEVGAGLDVVRHGFDGFEIMVHVHSGACETHSADARQSDPDLSSSPKKAVPVEYVTGRWADKEIVRTHELLDQGNTAKQIAKVLGRKPSAVSVFVAGLRKERGDLQTGGAATGHAKAAKSTAVKRKLVPGKGRSTKADTKPKVVKARISSGSPVASPVLQSGVAGDRPYVEREIIAHLDAVGFTAGWTAERDFELVEELCKGSDLGVVAAELRVGVDAAKDRWQLLNTDIGSVGHQVCLCKILRERAA